MTDADDRTGPRPSGDTPVNDRCGASPPVPTPIPDPEVEVRFQRAVERVHHRFGRAMKKLAE